jgi:hypothetical protein
MAISDYSDNSCSQTPKAEEADGKFVFGKAVTTSSGLTGNELALNLDNGNTAKALVAVNRKKMTMAIDFDGKQPSDFKPKSTLELDKIGASSGSNLSGDCEPCKSDKDCVSGTQCYNFSAESGKEATLCALPETETCPIGGN